MTYEDGIDIVLIMSFASDAMPSAVVMFGKV